MILGHERQVKYFDRVIARGRLGHAYLLHGPERVGKRATARAIARALVCPQYKKKSQSIADAGDDCRVCREIDTGVYPDLIMLDREHTLISDKDIRHKIPIDDVHEMKRRFAFAPAGDAWRIAIIDEIDTMSRDAEVAFLKLLEEPGGKTLFILITRSRDAVPATIVSRTIPVLFSPVPDSTLAPFVRIHMPRENPDDILALARGRAGLVAEWAREPRLLAEEKKLIVGFEKLFAGGAAELLALSERVSDDEMTRRRARTAWICSLRGHLFGSDSTERRRAAARIARALDITGTMDETNVNPRLAMDALFVG